MGLITCLFGHDWRTIRGGVYYCFKCGKISRTNSKGGKH